MIPISDTMPGPGLVDPDQENTTIGSKDYIGHGTAQDVASTSTAPAPDFIFKRIEKTSK